MSLILAVVDLTESSIKVLEVAERMVYAYEARLIILYPYRLIDHSFKGDVAKLKTKLEQEALENFSLLRKQITSIAKLSYEFQPEIGFAADRITSYLKLNKPEMIVIGQHQANTVNELNGMALQNLIMNSKLPFTIVPEVNA